MKKAIGLTLAVVLTMSASPLLAQKFGRVNSQDIMMVMPETKEMQTNLEAFGKDIQDNMETIQVEFNQKFQEYNKNVNTYSDSVRQLKEKELQELNGRMRDFEQIAQQDYQKRQQELLVPIIEKAKAAIDKVAAAGGYLVVFDVVGNSLAYIDEANVTDITPEVKKELGISETATPAPAETPAAQ